MNKVAIIAVSLILAAVVGLGGCVTVNVPEESEETPTLAPSPSITAPELVSPHNGATGVELSPIFLWQPVPNAGGYDLIVSLDSGFSDIVHSVSMASSHTSYEISREELASSTRYYWMVVAGLDPSDPHTSTAYSSVWTFTTAETSLQSSSPPEYHTLLEVEIYEVNVGNYRASYDFQGKPDPDFIEATFSWKTNKPCYFWFIVKPVSFDTPESGAGTGIQLFDVSHPLPQSLQTVEHSHDIPLRPGALHRYELTVWDREKNSARREGTFQAEGVSIPASSPPLESTIDDIFLSRWGHPYYNNAPRASYNSFDIDKLLIQISVQIPWQLYCYTGREVYMTTQAQIQGLGEFARRGFTLERPDDHVLFLMHEQERIAIFSQLGATPQSLQAECMKHLAIHHGWDGCLWKDEKDIFPTRR